MMPGRYNFTVRKKRTFDLTMTYKDDAGTPINLTGYDAQLQVRRRVTDAATVTELNVTNGKVTLGGSAGTIRLLLSPTDTDALQPGSYVYDLELISGGTTDTLLHGDLIVEREVTR